MAGVVIADDSESGTTDFSFWLGSHYTDYKDNPDKVGEYNLGKKEDILPEFKLNLISRSNGKLIHFDGHYYDSENINGKLKSVFGNRFNFEVQYRSLTKQQGQDLLDNLQAQEFVGLDTVTIDGNFTFKDKPGGKMLTHDITDQSADYNYNRHELMTKFSLMLSKKNNLKIVAAHRSIMKKGTEQMVTSNHCYSCHMTSKTIDVDKQTHQIEAGLEADIKNYSVGYTMGYRKFESKVDDPTADYDDAKHPRKITDTSFQNEFPTRLIYNDTTILYGVYPETEKISHKVRIKGKLGKGRLASSFMYSKTTNSISNLTSDAVSGAINYTVPLSQKTRLIAKASVLKMKADDPFIDLSTYREGRPGLNVDFDYTRYSSIDRMDGKFNAEVITRLNNRWTLSVMGEFRRIDRDDYPVYNEGWTTNKMIGQAKIRYRKGLKYTSSFKYRIEKTSDPYTSGMGLFEDVGRDYFDPAVATIFYFQREELRYQSITTEPTIFHQFDWNLNWQSSSEVSFSLATKVTYDKNTELDSLDVEHFTALPGIAINFMPDSKTVFTSGYTYGYYKSRGPVTVALFDG